MGRHPEKLTQAGITPGRYQELRGICRQYGEMKRALRRMRAGIVDRPRGRGAWHRPDPTAAEAVSLAGHPYAQRVKLIERCAATVAEPAVAKAILKNVSEGTEYDRLYPPPPCGRAQFYQARQRFYVELDKRLWED